MKRLIATFVACLATGSALAQDQITISYSDLDVATTDGASALLRRITYASEDVCRRELGVNGYFLWRNCVREAIARAVADVDNPLVTARYHRQAPAKLYSSRATTK